MRQSTNVRSRKRKQGELRKQLDTSSQSAEDEASRSKRARPAKQATQQMRDDHPDDSRSKRARPEKQATQMRDDSSSYDQGGSRPAKQAAPRSALALALDRNKAASTQNESDVENSEESDEAVDDDEEQPLAATNKPAEGARQSNMAKARDPENTSPPLSTSSQNSDDADQSQVIVDQYWSNSNEQKLQDGWTTDDEDTLNAISTTEVALWRKTQLLFNKSPCDLIPAEISPTPDGTDVVNWGQGLSLSLTKLVCCPAFKRQPEFLAYCLQLALYYRRGGTKPSKSAFPSERNKEFIALFDENVKKAFGANAELDEDFMPIMSNTLNQYFGVDKPKYYDFAKGIKESVYSHNAARGKQAALNKSNAITKRDVDSICDAWDEFAAKQRPRLADIEVALERANLKTPHGRVKAGTIGHKAKVLELKKQWVLNCRRKAIRARNQERAEASDSEDTPVDHTSDNLVANRPSSMDYQHADASEPQETPVDHTSGNLASDTSSSVEYRRRTSSSSLSGRQVPSSQVRSAS
ncbi:uncharacterized protein BP5553_05679 [Venustampulla echinocandica]|uniref:Uncharacterized protein n=1 Tax=Venustampulla echinocandica TaxID=2656787 RepID=A0A370TLG0_9HELO|nr:uncharacterized protein BP5553_05679 [Venustampulla echinocandica]RDL36327.1 hypothetical protein BP5553_05679 [Venustampulla echinocandica]